jgi:hypothetical protein
VIKFLKNNSNHGNNEMNGCSLTPAGRHIPNEVIPLQWLYRDDGRDNPKCPSVRLSNRRGCKNEGVWWDLRCLICETKLREGQWFVKVEMGVWK